MTHVFAKQYVSRERKTQHSRVVTSWDEIQGNSDPACYTLLDFLSFFFWLHHMACRIFPNQGSNSCALHWEHRILTTGPPGKSWILQTFYEDHLFPNLWGVFFYDTLLTALKNDF